MNKNDFKKLIIKCKNLNVNVKLVRKKEMILYLLKNYLNLNKWMINLKWDLIQ